MKLDFYFNKGFISRIVETELERYVNFFEVSYMENLEHCKAVIEKFSRWSIISGYYAMHDMTKLFLVKKFGIKVNFNVHRTTLDILKKISKDKEVLRLLEIGYKEFIEMANDLAEAREERTKSQYYTGSEFMKEKNKEKALRFLDYIVLPYIKKMESLLK